MDVLSRIVRATLLRIPDAAAEVAEKSAGRVGALCGRPTVIAAKAEAQHRGIVHRTCLHYINRVNLDQRSCIIDRMDGVSLSIYGDEETR